MIAFLNLVDTIINLYIWALIASAILSWLVAFNIINNNNQFVYRIIYFLHKLTDPLLRPIRQILPNLGGIDVSPIILILALVFIRNLLFEYLT
ncbi:YggT family protein [Alphaproteobacteria bacterium]|nr:YggT family protein [Alphaproteobacteria bacterium]|tara:strand:+ start:78 stop:356 length:279 start_codon:yes stop_codon:yes gene_type:complete